MCKISKDIRFCSCSEGVKTTDELRNYWILYRYNEHKEIHIIGEIMPPENDFSHKKIQNKELLLQSISQASSFDIPIIFQEKDRL